MSSCILLMPRTDEKIPFCGGDDCDDWHAEIHPGVPDVCGDGVDADCLGDVDRPTMGEWVGDYTIADQSDLVALRGYTSVTENLTFASTLIEFTGLECLEEVEGGLDIRSNLLVTDLSGLSGLTSVGWAIFTANTALASLEGLNGLTSISGGLWFVGNEALTSLDGLSGEIEAVELLAIASNSALMNLDGLTGLASVSIDLSISFNDSLTNVNGLAAVTSVGRRLEISNNDSLMNLDGLAVLASVGSELRIHSNSSLRNLDGFAALTSVGGDFSIGDNDTLTNLNGLAGLTSVGLLRIWANNRLPTCAAEALVAQLRAHGWRGSSEVWGNNDSGTCP